MEEDPYKAPVSETTEGVRSPNRILRALKVGTLIGMAFFAAIFVAAIVSLFFVDTRENPRYWDEIERREKAGLTHEEAVESLHEERRRAPAE